MPFHTSLKFKCLPVSVSLILYPNSVLYISPSQLESDRKHKFSQRDLVFIQFGPNGEVIDRGATTIISPAGYVFHANLHDGEWVPVYRVVAKSGGQLVYWVALECNMYTLHTVTVGILRQRG